MSDPAAQPPAPQADDLGGSYEVIRRRLLERANALGTAGESLNQKRKEVFGGAELSLAATERIRTENNCLPRDLIAVGGRLLVGFEVFVGMKAEVSVTDIFGLHRLDRGADGAISFTPLGLDDGGFLVDERFTKEFGDLFRYVREARLAQLRRTERRLLAVFSTGSNARDQKVFRWSLDGGGRIGYVDARGDEDHTRPRAHDFAWKQTTRENQVAGKFPHVSILDEVFVETIGGDLTIKVENNTASGQGLYAEPVEDRNQTLDDATIQYARLGTLIFLRIKPYRENAWRHFIFNARQKTVLRVDALEHAALALPDDQGVIFPTGYYLASGEQKIFDGDAAHMVFERVVKAPNGEDVLYVFFRESDGKYLLYPYNVIARDVATPIACHGYSLFDDGTMIVFRSTPGEEPTRVHLMQVWKTPFTTVEFAATVPTPDSYLARVGNPDLVRGVADALTLRKLCLVEHPTRGTYEDIIAQTRRLTDAYHWYGHAECFGLLAIVKDLRAIAEQIIDEYDKVETIRRRAAEALAKAEAAQSEVLRARPEDAHAVAEFMAALTALRKQRGVLGTLRDLRYMDLARVEALEAEVDTRFAETSKAAGAFLVGSDALKPLLEAIAVAVGKAEGVTRTVDLMPVSAEVDTVHEGLTVLSETVASLDVDDPTLRTKILDAISEVFAQLNRARAIVAARQKELRGAEGKAEFGAQSKLFAQAVQSALAVADSPEKCDQSLSRLLVQLEELEGRFGEFDAFATELAVRREELNDAFGARRQTLLDERQKRAQNLVSAADRILQGVTRRARTFAAPDELNAYFASDPMVAKVRDLSGQLRALFDTVKADEVDGRLKSARQEGLRALRDKSELFDGADNVIKLGRHRFFINTQPLELTIVPRDEGLAVHLAGTDYFDPIDDPTLASSRDLWGENLPSESPEVYRAEYLAAEVLAAAETGARGWHIETLRTAALTEGGLLALVRSLAADRHDEGYERGVHDVDSVNILDRVLQLLHTAGSLRHESSARALAVLYLSTLDEASRGLLHRRVRSSAQLRALTGVSTVQRALAAELTTALAACQTAWQLTGFDDDLAARAGRYLVDAMAADRPRYVLSGEAVALREAFTMALREGGAEASFDDDLRALDAHPVARLTLALGWLRGFVEGAPAQAGRAGFVLEVAVALVTERLIERVVMSAALEARVEGLLGQHPRVVDRAMTLRLDEFLARTDAFRMHRVPRWRAYRKARTDVAERERRRLRLDEFAPKVLSSFVRNKLIDEVYLPLVGANLAKQLGAAGDAKRTDLMGLLLLVSPPGYGKTTLMEYVASRLGLVFVKVNGPALGHNVVSIDPNEAPNATARQEVEKINLAFEMGNNVMLYLDDIQHTNPELLQKFISLCDGSRRIEGVWRGRTRTYDLRGKRFCIAMAGNPYTESGARFRIPDMLANRADTYNLGDILGGREDAFALSYLENALTSNASLAPLAGRSPQDLYKLIRMADGEAVPSTELEHPYSAAEVAEVVAVLRNLRVAQRTLLAVNSEYIRSASQEDSYRTEPPFKLQGSYRNMNKIAEKVVAAHTLDEVEAIVDDHYTSESQTLTTGAEQNLLKLGEMRGRLSDERRARWEAIKKEFQRQKRVGGKDDDPILRVTGTLSTLGEAIEGIGATLTQASAAQGEAQAQLAAQLGPKFDTLSNSLTALGRPQIEVRVPGPEASAEAIAARLAPGFEAVAPTLRAAQHGLGTLPALLESLVSTLGRLEGALARGVTVGVAAGAPVAQVAVAGAPVAAGPSAGLTHAPTLAGAQARAPEAGAGHLQMPSLPEVPAAVEGQGGRGPEGGVRASTLPPAARARFECELTAASQANLYLPPGVDLDVVRDGGVFVPTRKSLPLVGSSVILSLQFAGSPRFETTAVVAFRWEGESPGFGARFPYLTGAQEAIVRRFMTERAPVVLKR
ncbi:MAG: DNA repair ATPase [Myxococcales bacterium]|nr:DNA repair ATPase [Myxococcales bacterium]